MRLAKLVPIVLVLASCALGSPVPTEDEPSPAREVIGGRLHRRDLTAAPGNDVSALLAAARADLGDALAPITAADMGVAAAYRTGQSLVEIVNLRQQVEGIPIHGSYLHLTLRRAGEGAPARLLASSYRLFHSPLVDPVVSVPQADAIIRARRALREPPGSSVLRAELSIWPLAGVLRLVWDIGLAGVELRALVVANGREAGRVLLVDDRVSEAAGVVRGRIAVGGAPGGRGQPTPVNLGDLAVSAGDRAVFTAADGTFEIDAADDSTVLARLSGRAAVVDNQAGEDLADSAPAGVSLSLMLGTVSEASLAQVTAYHFITGARRFLVGQGFPVELFGAAVVARVNRAETCNAYYSPASRALSFFRHGGGCNNSAEASIVLHEYGHFVDDMAGGITDAGLSEGWGDLLACFALADPIVGPDFFDDGGHLRSCDNDYRFPRGGVDEEHELGQAWSGFVWHVRARLREVHGSAAGEELARALTLPALASNAADIPAAVRQVFLRDDDDADLANHTPHWNILIESARRHGLEFAVGGDLVAPAPVLDLEVVFATASSARIAWTATGNNGRRGRAARYDLRTSAAPIDQTNFAAATVVPTGVPAEVGAREEISVRLVPGQEAYFALVVHDESGNLSGLSNLAFVMPPTGHVILAEGAEGGTGEWVGTGLWHAASRRVAAGERAFWYGLESRGDFDTGAANYGTLTSPVVDLRGAVSPQLVFDEWLEVEDALDLDRVSVSAIDIDRPENWVRLDKSGGRSGDRFRRRALDLGPLRGRRVRVVFAFDSVDAEDNGLEGWFVDEIKVVADRISSADALVINEVLADPAAGFDANGDGDASTTEDEFVELVNAGAAPLDLAGASLADRGGTRLVFPSGTLLRPGGALVVFGGGSGRLEGVISLTAAGALSLNNEGDMVRILSPAGDVLAEMVYGAEGGRNESLTRVRDGDADSAFVGHGSLSSAPASPGTRVDGSPFMGGSSSNRI